MTTPIQQPEMTYSQALKELELRSVPSKDKLKKKYKQLVLKEHPDLKPPGERALATKKLAKINLAYKILLGPSPSSPFKKLAPYYRVLVRNVPITATDREIEAAYVNLVKTPQFRNDPDKSKALLQASELLKKTKGREEAIQVRARVRLKTILRNNLYFKLMSPEEQEIYLLREQAKKQAFNQIIQNIKEKLSSLSRKTVRKKGRHHVPIRVKKDSKKAFKRFIILTGALVAGILAGRYVWDEIAKAYRKRAPVKLIQYRRK